MTPSRTAAPVRGALILQPLEKLRRDGFDLAVLMAIERDALLRAHRVMQISGLQITRESLVEAAGRDLPRNERLLQAYAETSANLSSRPVRELETIASMLAQCAQSLEADAVRHLAGGDQPYDATRALAHHTIGERLADLMQGAETLARSGIVAAPGHASRLESVTQFIQSGPLSRFLDKALALLSERNGAEESSPRLAMAG